LTSIHLSVYLRNTKINTKHNTTMKTQSDKETLLKLEDKGISFIVHNTETKNTLKSRFSVWPNTVWGKRKISNELTASLLRQAGFEIEQVESCFLIK